MKSEIYEADQLLDEASLTFEVSQSVAARLDEVLTELEVLSLSGGDRKYIRQAIRHLQQIRERSGDSPGQLLADVRDAASAGHSLGQVRVFARQLAHLQKIF